VGSYGFGITAGPDGNIWTGLNDNNHVQDKIEGFKPDGTPIGPFNTLTPFALLTGVASGRDGKLWFVELGVNGLGRFDPTTLTWDGEASFPTSNSSAYFVTAGPDDPTTMNKTVWSTEFGNNKVAQYVIDGMPFGPGGGGGGAATPRRPGVIAGLVTPNPIALGDDQALVLPSSQERNPQISSVRNRQFSQRPAGNDLLVSAVSNQHLQNKTGHDEFFAGFDGLDLLAGLDAEFLLSRG
jgi:hypothetical protein